MAEEKSQEPRVTLDSGRDHFRVLSAQGSAGRALAAPMQRPATLTPCSTALSPQLGSFWPSPEQKSVILVCLGEGCDPDAEHTAEVLRACWALQFLHHRAGLFKGSRFSPQSLLRRIHLQNRTFRLIYRGQLSPFFHPWEQGPTQSSVTVRVQPHSPPTILPAQGGESLISGESWHPHPSGK